MATRKELANLTPGGIQIWATEGMRARAFKRKKTLAQIEFKEIIFKGKIVLTLYIYEVEQTYKLHKHIFLPYIFQSSPYRNHSTAYINRRPKVQSFQLYHRCSKKATGLVL